MNNNTRSTTLTTDSQNLFDLFVEDSGNWGGMPLIGGNVEMTPQRKGNLSDLVQKGLCTVDEMDGETWFVFTDKGIEHSGLTKDELSIW